MDLFPKKLYLAFFSQQKVSHMKKCCKESNVDRRELLQLVREVSTSDLTLNTVQKSEDQLSIPARTVNDLVL